MSDAVYLPNRNLGENAIRSIQPDGFSKMKNLKTLWVLIQLLYNNLHVEIQSATQAHCRPSHMSDTSPLTNRRPKMMFYTTASHRFASFLLTSFPQSHSERQLPVWLPAPLAAWLVGDTWFASWRQCHLRPPRKPKGHEPLPGSVQQLCVRWVKFVCIRCLCGWPCWARGVRGTDGPHWQFGAYILAHICLCAVFV